MGKSLTFSGVRRREKVAEVKSKAKDRTQKALSRERKRVRRGGKGWLRFTGHYVFAEFFLFVCFFIFFKN